MFIGDGENSVGKEGQHPFTQGVYIVVIVEDEKRQKAAAQITI